MAEGGGARGTASASADSEVGGPARPVPAGLMLGYVDLAIRGTLEYERYAQVYVSPWWELQDLPEGVRAWKRAVLERVPMRGANHWGHLYLVVAGERASAGRWAIRSKGWDGRVRGTSDVDERIPLRRGTQTAELVVHPSHPDRQETLRRFAAEIETRFRRQMD